MKVFKFGGASVKDADSVKNVCKIIEHFKEENLWIVVSAMGKSTNKLEAIIETFYKDEIEQCDQLIEDLKNEHLQIVNELQIEKSDAIFTDIDKTFKLLKAHLIKYKQSTYNFIYDQIICTGEIISTKIVAAYLVSQNIDTNWIDVRQLIKTNNQYREAVINWEESQNNIQKFNLDNASQINVVQGFIGADQNNFTTTLGREGSDFTAAIIAYCLDAESVSIWKDVEGILSGDPKAFKEVELLENISYYDAIEMTFYGAKVIHPKTIKPLQNKEIPLYVRSFENIEKQGTKIGKHNTIEDQPPVIVLKENQLLINIKSKDFSFIAEQNLSKILDQFAKYNLKINLLQTAAISIDFCVDKNPQKTEPLIKALEELNYSIECNKNLEILTLRNYTEDAIKKYLGNKKVLLTQKSQKTIQFVIQKD